MKSSVALLIVALSLPWSASAAERGRAEQPELPAIHSGDQAILYSAGRLPSSFKAGATPDTVCLYGGPGTNEGKFQMPDGVTPDIQGWIGFDETDVPTKWQRSTFNSPTGSWAMWAGQDASQEPGWAAAPGYGNSWNVMLEYRKTVSNPAAGQTVGLEFIFNHDTEPGYDYFYVEYDSAGTTQTVYRVDGYNKPSHGSPIFTPLQFPTDVITLRNIAYAGNDYAGDGNDEILLRLRVTSDGAWSDQDGLWPTSGAAQVDDIRVTSSEGVDFEDFEGAGPVYQWVPKKAPYAGDFARVFARVTDIDPCRDNASPVAAFIDDGTGPFNPDYSGPGTGGTTSVNYNYGLPGNWVVNYNGGVSFGTLNLANYIISPAIEWDLPGTEDDDPNFAGAILRTSVYEHLNLFDGMFHVWYVRSSLDGGSTWTQWESRNFVYYSASARWVNREQEIGDLIVPGRTHVQVELGVNDLANVFAFPGTDASVSPLFDNVAFLKYRIAGPTFAARNIDLFQDSFTQTGLSNVSTQGDRDLMDVRVDMARDVGSGIGTIVPGDSIIVDITSVLPGVAISDSLTQIRMHYSLNMNPTFEAAIRGNAPVTDPGAGLNGWDQSEGTIAPYQSTTTAGVPIADRYAFDFPDADFMYPGDILEYYIAAEDDAGNSSYLPANRAGYDDPSFQYDRTFTVRALPTFQDDAGSQPGILVWNDFGHRGGEDELFLALDQVGLVLGDDYDVYTTMGPSSRVSNGLGSTGGHGASSDQLAGYACIVYDGGDLPNTLEDNDAGSWADKEDDVGVLLGWFNDLNANRNIVHFADNIASSLSQSGSTESASYLSTVMGVADFGSNVRPQIDGQTAPRVKPSGSVAGYNSEFVAFGGCLVINRFDWIDPLPGAVGSHGYTLPGSSAIYGGIAAGVVWDRLNGQGARKVSVTFPYGFTYVYGDPSKVGESARAILLRETLNLFGSHPQGMATPTPPRQFLELAPAAPSPFNPRTTLSFALGRDGIGSVRIYNVRGELVRTLADDQAFTAGRNELIWDGRDDRGAGAASGVYAVEVRVEDMVQAQKVVLLK